VTVSTVGSFRQFSEHVVKRVVRTVLFGLFRATGVPFLIRETRQRARVTILVYHALPAARADIHFVALRRRYNVISLSDFLTARSIGTMERLPSKPLIITFDDGHRGNYDLRSVLARSRVPVTIFLCSGLVGTQRHFWWSHAPDPTVAQAWKKLPDEERAAALRECGHTDTREYDTRQALSVNEIEQMKSIIDFQSHTVFHPILPACSAERARSEIFESKTTLEQKLGLTIYAMAYPNGDCSDREVELLREASYTCGLTMQPGFNDIETDVFRLRRLAVSDDAGVNELLVKASGLWAVLRAIAQMLVNGTRRIVGAHPV